MNLGIQQLEEKIADVRMSFHHQLSLVSSPGYDPKLTFFLKKDIEWLEKQKSDLEEQCFPQSYLGLNKGKKTGT